MARLYTSTPRFSGRHAGSEAALSTAVLVAMWNYMGWDNASTVAQEVENPQRNYPRAMIVAAMLAPSPIFCRSWPWLLPASPSPAFSTGDWMIAANAIGGPLLGVGRRSRWRHLRHRHVQRADDELHAPAHGDGRRRNASALCCSPQQSRTCPGSACCFAALAWALALKLNFERLISIDLILYGSSLLLEFVALVVLRLREPRSHAALQSRQSRLCLFVSESVLPSSSVTRSMRPAERKSRWRT